MKRRLADAGVRTAPFISVNRDGGASIEPLTFPVA